MRLTLAAALAALPLAAPAATLSWVSATDHPEAPVVSQGGVTVTASPGLVPWDDSLFASRGLDHPDPGLGACVAPCDRDGGDSLSAGEWLAFDFGEPVDVIRLVINWTPPAFTQAGGAQPVLDHQPWTGTLSTSEGALDVREGLWTGMLRASLLRIDGWSVEGNPEAAIYVGALDYETPAPIPLPGGIWLLGAALAGLGALRMGRGRA